MNSASMCWTSNLQERAKREMKYSNEFCMYWVDVYVNRLYQGNDSLATRMKTLSLNFYPSVPVLSVTLGNKHLPSNKLDYPFINDLKRSGSSRP